MTKKVHIFTSQKNYTSSQRDKSKLRVSLAHSLRCISRMPSDALEKVQWDDSLTHLNLLFKDNQFTPLSDVTESEKEALIDDLLEPPIKDKRLKQVTLNNYKKKIRSAISKEQSRGNLIAARLLNGLLDSPPSEHIDINTALIKFENKFQTRENQRLKMVENYIVAHNALTQDSRCGSRTRYQEIVFKIPEKWEVKNNELSAEDIYKLVKNYLKQMLPNHPILFAISHMDENISIEHCAHLHVFVDGKNAETGHFDLREAELSAINSYVDKNNLNPDNWNRIKHNKNYGFSRERGRLWQQIFLNAANAYFKHHKITIVGQRAIQTEDNQKQRDQMRIESKAPKASRSHNFHTLAEQRKSLLQKELLELEQEVSKQEHITAQHEREKHKLKQLKLELVALEQSLSEKKKAIEVTSKAIKNQQTRLEDQNAREQHLKKSLIELEDQKASIEEFKDNFMPTIIDAKKSLELFNAALDIQANDESMKPVAVLFKMLKQYFTNFKENKRSDENMFNKIVRGFRNLTCKIKRKIVYDHASVLSREVNDNTLLRELRLISKHEPNTKLEPKP